MFFCSNIARIGVTICRAFETLDTRFRMRIASLKAVDKTENSQMMSLYCYALHAPQYQNVISI